MSLRVGGLFVVLFVGPADAELPVAPIEREAAVNYAEEVFPVLKKNCLACHNSTKAKAGLNMETPALMVEGGDSGTALVPGKPEDSWVFLSAAHLEDPTMPPAKNKSNARNLNAEELGLLRRWITEGAEGGAELGRDTPLEWRTGPGVGSGAPIYHLAMGPAGKRVAFAQGRRVFVYNVAAGQIEGELTDPAVAGGGAHLDYVQSLAFAPDGRLVTGGFRNVKIWAAGAKSGGAPVDEGVWKAAGAERVAAAVLPGGERMVVGGADGAVRLWDGERAVVLKGHGAPVALVDGAAADAGVLVSADSGGEVIVWKLENGTAAKRWPTGGALADLAVSEDGTRVVTVNSGRGAIVLWDATSGKKVADLDGRAGEREVLAMWERLKQTEGGLAGERTKQRDAAAKQVEDDKKRLADAAAAAKTDSDAAAAVAAEIEGLEAKTATNTEDAEAKKQLDEKRKAFEAAERKRVGSERNHEVAQRLLGRAEDALKVAEGRLAAAQARDANFGKRVEEAKAALAQPKPVSWGAVGFAAGGGLVVALRADGAAVWGASTGQMIREIGGAGTVNGLGIDGAVVSGDVVLEAELGWGLERQLGAIDDRETISDRVSAVAFSPDGSKLVAATGVPSRSGELVQWDTGSWQEDWRSEDAHSDTINEVAFSPHGDSLVTAGADRMVRRFDAADGALMDTFEGHGSYVTSVSVRADGLRVASAGTDNTVRVWELETGKSLETKKGYKRGVGAVAFAGNGNRLVSASGDPALKIDNDTLFSGGDYVHCAAASADGAIVAGGCHDGVLRVWRVSDKKLIAEVRVQ